MTGSFKLQALTTRKKYEEKQKVCIKSMFDFRLPPLYKLLTLVMIVNMLKHKYCLLSILNINMYILKSLDLPIQCFMQIPWGVFNMSITIDLMNQILLALYCIFFNFKYNICILNTLDLPGDVVVFSKHHRKFF